MSELRERLNELIDNHGLVAGLPKDMLVAKLEAFVKAEQITGMEAAKAEFDMFLFFVRGSQFQVNRPPLLGIYPEGTTITGMEAARDIVQGRLAELRKGIDAEITKLKEGG